MPCIVIQLFTIGIIQQLMIPVVEHLTQAVLLYKVNTTHDI